MPGVDAKLFDTPEMKKQVLDGMIRERVLMAAADKAHLVTTNERLQRELLAIPQLAQLKKTRRQLRRRCLQGAAERAGHVARDVRGAHAWMRRSARCSKA